MVHRRETYYDEIDADHFIKVFSRNPKTQIYVLHLHRYFFNDHYPNITVSQFRKMFMITYRSNAYDLLEAMTNMMLLEKVRVEHNFIYRPINKFWWDRCGKEVLENGREKEGGNIKAVV